MDEYVEELTEEPMGESAMGPAEETAMKHPLWDEGHHSGASEKLRKGWSFMRWKKRLTACVEDRPSGHQDQWCFQEDYKGDEHGHLWLQQCLYIDKVTYPEELLVHNGVQIDFVCYCKICINKVVVWLWSWGHAQICGGKVWHCKACRVSLVGQMGTSAGHNRHFFVNFYKMCQ